SNRQGLRIAPREVMLHPPAQSEITLGAGSNVHIQEFAATTLIAGLALLEIVLLAGPAFAVSARRRQRQLALVAANGGTPAHIRRIVLADGGVLRLVAPAVGVALGLGPPLPPRPVLRAPLAPLP